MKIKLDENLPATVAITLRALGYDVHTIHDENLVGCDDPTLWAAAQRERRFLITQDLDFSDIRQFAPGTHAGIMVIRLTTPGRLALAEKIETAFRTESTERWPGGFLVLTDHKLSLRLAPPT